jgi:hypothetical protein
VDIKSVRDGCFIADFNGRGAAMTGEDFLTSSSSSELVSQPTASLRVRTFSGCLREGRPKLECGMVGGGAGGAVIGGGTRTGEAVRSLAGD